MSSFTEPLDIAPAGGTLWATARDLRYDIGAEGSGWTITVPAGFHTDLGTIPGAFRWLINPADAGCAAAFVLHDWLCKLPTFNRFLADAILYEALLALGVPRWKAVMIHAGVSAYRVFVRPFKIVDENHA